MATKAPSTKKSATYIHNYKIMLKFFQRQPITKNLIKKNGLIDNPLNRALAFLSSKEKNKHGTKKISSNLVTVKHGKPFFTKSGQPASESTIVVSDHIKLISWYYNTYLPSFDRSRTMSAITASLPEETRKYWESVGSRKANVGSRKAKGRRRRRKSRKGCGCRGKCRCTRRRRDPKCKCRGSCSRCIKQKHKKKHKKKQKHNRNHRYSKRVMRRKRGKRVRTRRK